MQYWLMKSEPGSFSIDDLQNAKNQTTSWDGVRNYQARNMMRDDMKTGDNVFFYHSNCSEPGIVGTMTVSREAHPDFTALDPEDHHYDPKSTRENPRWCMVDVRFKSRFAKTVTLAEMRATPALEEMLILRRGNRLSITPVTKEEWRYICAMGKRAT
ncbi:MAG TPA: EVE domain-containing protein [Gammaproteobacteria bacterium]|nr:EVE domain-containing protein [Gammaproteobacteria bacterium]